MELGIEKKMQVLKEVLGKETGIGKSEYTLELGGMCPCGMGMDCIDGAWYTYSCERGEKFDFNKFSKFEDAVCDLMKMVAPDNEAFVRICGNYENAIKEKKRRRNSYYQLNPTELMGRLATHGKVALKPVAAGRAATRDKETIKLVATTGRTVAHGKATLKSVATARKSSVAKQNIQKEDVTVRGKGMGRNNKGISKANHIRGRIR